MDAEIRRQEEQVATTENTWTQDVSARQAELRSADRRGDARRVDPGAPSAPSSAPAPAPSSSSTKRRRAAIRRTARATAPGDMLARTEAEKGTIRVARHQLEVLRQQRELAERQLDELRVTHDKSAVKAPAGADARRDASSSGRRAGSARHAACWRCSIPPISTCRSTSRSPTSRTCTSASVSPSSSTARPATACRARSPSSRGQRELTPEKIETRDDRVGQVYRAKVKILEGVERFRPGTEGNVYLEQN
jgi:hypothetical protein